MLFVSLIPAEANLPSILQVVYFQYLSCRRHCCVTGWQSEHDIPRPFYSGAERLRSATGHETSNAWGGSDRFYSPLKRSPVRGLEGGGIGCVLVALTV